MVALTVWYTEDPLTIASADDVHTLIDRIIDETKDHKVPSMIQIDREEKGQVMAAGEIGIGQERGFVSFWSRDLGAYESEGSSAIGVVVYDYMANYTEVPAHMEIPIADVRQWLVDLVTTGRPSENVSLRRTDDQA